MRGGFREPLHFSFHFFDSSCLCNTQCVCSVQYTMCIVCKYKYMKKCSQMQINAASVCVMCFLFFLYSQSALSRIKVNKSREEKKITHFKSFKCTQILFTCTR